MSAGWGQMSMHQPQQPAFHWVPTAQPVHLAARPPTPTRAQTSASPMRRPPNASAAQSPRPGVWSARPPSPGGAGLPLRPPEHQVRQWAVAGPGQPLMPRGGALPPRYSSPTMRYTSPTPSARAEGRISAGSQVRGTNVPGQRHQSPSHGVAGVAVKQKAGQRHQSPSHGVAGVAVKQHRSAGAASPARRPPASPPLLIPAEPANSLAEPGSLTDKAFDAEPARPVRPASVRTVIASNSKPNDEAQGLEKRTAEKLHDLQQAIRAHAATMGVNVNAMLVGNDSSIDEILLREAGLQVMRDRARARSAESALFSYQGGVAMILENAQRDQAEMLRSLNDASTSKLLRIQRVLSNTHANVSVLKALLLRAGLQPEKSVATEAGRAFQAGVEGKPHADIGVANAGSDPVAWSEPEGLLTTGVSTGFTSKRQLKLPGNDEASRKQAIEPKPLQHACAPSVSAVRTATDVVGEDNSANRTTAAQWTPSQFDHELNRCLENFDMHSHPVMDRQHASPETGQVSPIVRPDLSLSDVYPELSQDKPTYASCNLGRGHLGLSLHQEFRGDRRICCVTFVAPASPAFRAGIRPGNELRSINELEVDGLPFSRVCNCLASLDHNAITLGVAECCSSGRISNTRRVTLDVAPNKSRSSSSTPSAALSPASVGRPWDGESPTVESKDMRPGRLAVAFYENGNLQRPQSSPTLSPQRIAAAAATSSSAGGHGSFSNPAVSAFHPPQAVDLAASPMFAYRQLVWDHTGKTEHAAKKEAMM